MIRNIREVKECPDCASDNIVYDDEREQVICRDCGLIFEPLTPDDETHYEAGYGADVERRPAPKTKKGVKKKAKPRKKK